LPRLSNRVYYEKHLALRQIWNEQSQTFGYLSAVEQHNIHDFFQPSKELSFEELVAHRKRISQQRPSLPAVAAKAVSKLGQYGLGLRKPRQARPVNGRQISVRAVVRPEIDVEKLAKAMLELAKEMAAGDS
jgi:hypothetical protein